MNERMEYLKKREEEHKHDKKECAEIYTNMKREMNRLVDRLELVSKEYDLTRKEVNDLKKNKDVMNSSKAVEVNKLNNNILQVLHQVKKTLLSKGDQKRFMMLLKDNSVTLNKGFHTKL
eukprot:CAMPEP_0116984410 /NCGR_PEP_ID=MMETSP0467-20121206/61582_1 /TAXON_ID=283647 /ORGANISM="Mesodinium pulex, Strain SPMC105" /LENGTH=118 /DNA_ID=CAMNT_0004679409 /DNA_START=1648 /DNA_END=2004 /DNA_ORIENTATION=+